jgi:hypothetical protein
LSTRQRSANADGDDKYAGAELLFRDLRDKPGIAGVGDVGFYLAGCNELLAVDVDLKSAGDVVGLQCQVSLTWVHFDPDTPPDNRRLAAGEIFSQRGFRIHRKPLRVVEILSCICRVVFVLHHTGGPDTNRFMQAGGVKGLDCRGRCNLMRRLSREGRSGSNQHEPHG